MTGIAAALANDVALSALALTPVGVAVAVGHVSTRRHRAAMEADAAREARRKEAAWHARMRGASIAQSAAEAARRRAGHVTRGARP